MYALTHPRQALLIGLTAALAAGGAQAAAGAAPGAAQHAAPQNGRIVYAAESAGAPTQLFTILPDGSGATQITQGPGTEAGDPDWSHDGTRLVFGQGSDSNAGIWISAADGSGARNLTPKGFQGQPAFSPDDRTIVYERDISPRNNGVWLMRTDGSHKRRLTRNPFSDGKQCGCDTDPNFSPDGKTVTFVRVKEDEHLQALFAIRTDGTHLRRLTPYSWDVGRKHDWSPDGKRIVLTYHADPGKGQAANVVSIRRDGTGLKRLTHLTHGRGAFAGGYSPDGKRIVLRFEDGGDTYRLATMDTGGGAIQTLMSGPIRPRYIDWGPAT